MFHTLQNSNVSEIEYDACQEDALWYSAGTFTRILYSVKDTWSHSSTRNLTSCAVIFILHILPRYTSSSHYSRRKWNTSAKLALNSMSKWHASTLQNCLGPTVVSGNSKTPTFQSLWNAGVSELPVSPRGFYRIVSLQKPQNLLNMSVHLTELTSEQLCFYYYFIFFTKHRDKHVLKYVDSASWWKTYKIKKE